MRYAIILLAGCISILASPINANIDDEGFVSKIIDDAELNTPLLDMSAAPNSIVGGAVNVITGNYFECDSDLVIPSAHPLVLQRSFHSGNNAKGNLCHGWDLNLPSKITMFDITSAYVNDRGAILSFERRSRQAFLKIAKKQLRFGVTNCSTGELSSQTNIKNKKLFHTDLSTQCELQNESGEKLSYALTKKNYNTDHQRDFTVRNIQSPNGCSYKYDYDTRDRLSRVTSKGGTGKELGFIEWIYPHKFKDTPQLKLASSNGRKICYEYEKQHSRDGEEHRYYLKTVQRNYAPKISYDYRYVSKNKIERMVRKSLPQNRFLEIQYYEKGDNKFGSRNIYISKSDDSRVGRVLSLYAPVGTDATPILTWSFKYYLDKDHHSRRPIGGKAEVVDALGHRKMYHFSDEQRLTSVEHFLDNGRLYREEKMLWGESGDDSETFMLARGLTDCNEMMLIRRSYIYDVDGNVLQETLRGNLSGLQHQGIHWTLYKQSEKYTKTYTYTSKGLLNTENDGRKKTIYSYVENTNLLKLKLVCNGDKICERYHYVYDSNGVLIEEIIDDGNSKDIANLSGVTERHIKKITPTTTPLIGLPKITEEFVYNTSKRQTVSLGRLENTYSKEGHLLRQDTYDSQGAYSFSKEWKYDLQGSIEEETDALGRVTTYKYDKNNNRIFQQTPNLDFYILYTYDFANRLICQKEIYTNGQELVTRNAYDYMGNLTASTDIYGNTTEFCYDEFGRLIKKINPPIEDISGKLVSPIDKVAYDCMNNPTERTDANGNTTETYFTAWGKPYLIIYPDGSQESFVYGDDGVLEKSIARNGSYTIHEHDYQQRCTSKRTFSSTGQFLTETSATYSAFRVLTEVDASGSKTYYTYDPAGRKIKVRKNDAETNYVYDSLGREIECQERCGNRNPDFIIKAKQYDLLNRVIVETVQDFSKKIYQKVVYGYDAMGNRNSVTLYNDAGVNLQLIEYDARNQPIKIIDALGNITTTHFDYSYSNTYGQIVAYKETVDPLGNRDITILDAMGNVAVTLRKNSFGETTQKREFFYDSCCKKIRLEETVLTYGKDDRQVVTEWMYDGCGRVISLTEAKGTPEFKQTRYTYTDAGEKKEIIKPDGTVLMHVYDDLGRLDSLSSSDGSVYYNYTYDLLNNPVQIYDAVNNIATIKAYDDNNRLKAETLGNKLTIQYKYDRLGRITLLELPDGTSQETTYSSAQISEVRRLAANGSVAYRHRYTRYDLSGNMLEAELAGNVGKMQIHYDLLGRPSSVQAPNWSEILEYDAVGNVTRRNLIENQEKLDCCYSYDDLYQLKSETGVSPHEYQYDSLYNRTAKDEKPLMLNSLNQLLSDTETTYSYDLNGNLIHQIGSSGFNCTYDALDRLVSVQTRDETINYLYDSENRRLSKTGDSSGTSRYFYIGNCEIGCCDADGKIVEYRLLGQGKGAEIGAAIALEINGEVYIPLHESQGNLTTLLNLDGQVVGGHRYSAFGEETLFGIAEMNPWRFSSKRFDSETGYIYFGRRYYSPTTGRWVTPDPIGSDGGPNLYCYVFNTPLTHFDLYGLFDNRGKTICGFPFPSPSREDFALYPMLVRSIVQPVMVNSKSTVRDSSLFLNNKEIHPQPVESFHVGAKVMTDRGMGFSNGICTSRERAEECGQLLSGMSGGYRCDIVHNPSGGLVNDVTRYLISSRSLIATNVVPELHKTWNNFFDNSSPDSRYLQIGHSEGCNNIRNGILSYPKERASRITVLLIAPSVYIDSDMCGKATHYRCTHDIVPLVDSSGKARNIESTHVLERHPEANIWDHDFTSPTYAPSIKEHIERHFQIGS
jgi:RHS repeat-associated protein